MGVRALVEAGRLAGGWGGEIQTELLAVAGGDGQQFWGELGREGKPGSGPRIGRGVPCRGTSAGKVAALAVNGVPQLGIVGRTVPEFGSRFQAHLTGHTAAPAWQGRVLTTGTSTIAERKTVCRVVDGHGTPQLPSLNCGRTAGRGVAGGVPLCGVIYGAKFFRYLW